LNENAVITVKKAIWLYFWLLIFEGALRKWVLPGLAEPLLIIRDPIAIYILFKVTQKNIWRPNNYVKFIWGITILSLIFTLYVGHGNLIVAMYGMRITIIHFPLLFVIGHVFNKDDVLKMGKIILYITIGMTVLVAFQFFSPQSAWVNRGVGGDLAGSGFGAVRDFYRVPGTFSFTNGLALFYGLSAAFIFYFLIGEEENQVPKILLVLAAISLVIAIPLSISRTILLQTILSLIFLLLSSGKSSLLIKKFITIIFVGAILLVGLNKFNFFQTASSVFTERIEIASKTEGGIEGTIVDRLLGGMYSAIADPENSYMGLGLGLGSKVASKLLTGETSAYLLPEGEWGRIIGEMGLLLGLLLILTRVGLVLEFFKGSWTSIGNSNVLPWLLLSFGAITILQGQWSQPTALGFSILVGGLIIAAFKQPEKE